MENSIAITLDNVGKRYRIYKKPQHRIYHAISNALSNNNDTQSSIINTAKYFSEFWALKNISLEIKKGETVGLVGRNGSGKSTLLQIVSNVLTSNTGKVTSAGKISALLELGAGFNPEYTGRENIFTNGAILGLTQNEIREKMRDIIDFSELEAFIDRPVKTYSSGMYIRLAFSVAIHTNPDILIIDEALAVGDEAFQRKCFSKIKNFKNNGGTMLFVSHNSSLILELCDHAVLLEKGDMVFHGSPKAVVTAYQKLLYSNDDLVSEIKAESLSVNINKKHEDEDNIIDISEHYDPKLIPSSTVYYKSNGITIHNASIKTTSNKPVNILVPRNEYIFTYTVEFNSNAEKVRFGMLLKTITGLELGGATSSLFSNSIDKLTKNSTVDVEFRFKCLLSNGTYFLNAGVTSNASGSETFLARAIDVLMIKVQENKDLKMTGTVDFLISATTRHQNRA